MAVTNWWETGVVAADSGGRLIRRGRRRECCDQCAGCWTLQLRLCRGKSRGFDVLVRASEKEKKKTAFVRSGLVIIASNKPRRG